MQALGSRHATKFKAVFKRIVRGVEAFVDDFTHGFIIFVIGPLNMELPPPGRHYIVLQRGFSWGSQAET